MKKIADKLYRTQDATDAELLAFITSADAEADQYLFSLADSVRKKYYGTDVYIRGLIEISNHCKNNCYYCGVRCGNKLLERYRLHKEQILSCCKTGYSLGFRTFVLQGGEDGFYTDAYLCDVISEIKRRYSDCAVTLSLGERSKESYRQLYDAGADRYLLRHETADEAHYKRLHPDTMQLSDRKQCLFQLKEIGYQVGSGFMVGSPWQTPENLLSDIRFLQKLSPAMIGIGPFLPHKDTPFHDQKSGNLQLTLRMLALLRLLFPAVLLPATTALGTLSPIGRELGLQGGANVVMPNLSPTDVRKLYSLYDNKICTGEEAAECLQCLKKRVQSVGYEIVTDRGDSKVQR